MRFTAAWQICLLQFAGAAVLQQREVSYDGYKVFRLAVGDDVEKITSIVDKLGLSTWKGAPRAGAMADIVVPPEILDSFKSETAGIESFTMHEDLGASISDESKFSVYAGKNDFSSFLVLTSTGLTSTSLDSRKSVRRPANT